MTRFWPGSLIGRTVVVLLVGLVLSNLIGFALYWHDRIESLADARTGHLATRIVSLTAAVEEIEPTARPDFVRQLRGPGFRVAFTPTEPLAPAHSLPTPWVRALHDAVTEEWGSDPGDRLLIGPLPPEKRDTVRAEYEARRYDRRHSAMMDRDGPPPAIGRGAGRGARGGDWRDPRFRPDAPLDRDFSVPIFAVSVALNGGGWLNFLTYGLNLQPFWETSVFLPLLLSALAVIAISVLAVWRATAPLALFTQAAERLGRNVTAPPLDERGPREVSHAARAFNRMQMRLRSFIDDRTQMLAAISHDLRTPITRMRLRAEFVEDDEQRGKMLRDLDEMEAMIAATLSFAREEEAARERVQLDVADLLQSLCDQAVDSGQSVAYSGPRRLAFHGAPMALKRAFSNLIENAVKYGHAARVGLEEGAEEVIVTVEDDGPGVPDDQLERVFAAFYRVEGSRSRETGGVGLGLAVVRSIIRGHGGDVTLANRPEGGLRATVILPRD